MLWSILTNRTLLWKYYDSDACRRWGGVPKSKVCSAANTVQDCDQILARAEWIPGYDEWSEKLGLDSPFQIPYHATHPVTVPWDRFPWHEGDEKLFGVDVNGKYPQQVVIFGEGRFKFNFLEQSQIRDKLLITSVARERSAMLHELGVDFLYGMLFRYSFDFAHVPRRGLIKQQNQAESFSIGLHSRHMYEKDDGCDIHGELECLEKSIKDSNRTIEVNIMADRVCTIERLRLFLSTRNLTVTVAAHDEGKSYHAEHGPFAGAGFFQDLALVSQSRSLFIGTKRSSSALLLELMEFNRKLNWWKAGNDLSTVGSIQRCYLTY